MSDRERIRNVHTGLVYVVLSVDKGGVLTQCPAQHAVYISAAKIRADYELVTA
jgi:hypothetical protein